MKSKTTPRGALVRTALLTGFLAAHAPAVEIAGSLLIGYTYSVEGSTDPAFPAASVSHVSVSDIAPAATGLPDLTGTGWEYHTFRLEGSEGLPGRGFLRVNVTP
jgi:hypothetical protein